jgi:hypothetical protein
MPQVQGKPEETRKKMTLFNRKPAKWKVCRMFVAICEMWLKSEMCDNQEYISNSPPSQNRKTPPE